MKTLMILAGVVLLVAVAYVQEVSYGPTAGGGSVATLTDVSLSSPVTDGHVLAWSDALSVWTNSAAGAGIGDFLADGTVPMTGDLAMGGNDISGAGAVTVTSLTNSGLTASRIVLSDANRALSSSALTEANILTEAEAALAYQPLDADLTRVGGIGAGASGDVIYRDATGWTNLVKGTDGQVLKLASGFPSWAADESAAGGESSGTVHAPDGATTANRIALFKDTTGTNITQAAVGVADLQPTSVPLNRVTGIGAGASGDVFYRDATGWTNLVKGTDGQVLKLASGLPSWAADAGLTEAAASLLYHKTNTALTTWEGITPGANVGTFLATPSSANFASAVTGETGSGGVVLSNAPSIFNLTLLGTLQADLDMGDNDITNVVNLTVTTLNTDTLNVTEAIDGVNLTNIPNLEVTTAIILPNASVADAAIASTIARDSEVSAAITAATNWPHLTVNDDAYAAGWDGSTNLPTKNAVFDKIELLSTKADPTFTGTATIPTASVATATIGTGTVTNNIRAIIDAPVATNIVDMTFASRSVTLNAALTFLNVTNGVASRDMSHVLYLRAGGENRALAVHAGWQTNAFSPVPAYITNGWLTKIYFTTIGATDSAANQTNVLVSFEYYKVP